MNLINNLNSKGIIMNKIKSYKIQLLRGLAIIAVILIHSTPGGLMQVYVRPFLNFAVGLFLFLSGLLTTNQNWHPQKRLKKILIPYVLWTLIYVALTNYQSGYMLPVIYFKKLLTGQSAAIMYFIFVYAELTLMVPVIDKLAHSKYKFLGLLISPIEIIFMRTIPILSGYQFNDFFSTVMSISFLGWFTYYYLDYLLGNNLIGLKFPTIRLVFVYMISIVLQIFEGLLYYNIGVENCGTQLKITSLFSGILLILLSYKYISSNNSEQIKENKILKLLGDYSFGIYFSHLAVMMILNKIPSYSTYIIYPLNALMTCIFCILCVFIGRTILGKHHGLLAF